MKNMSKILENGKGVIIPMDHGVSEGPILGIENIRETVSKVEKYATAMILHKGIIKALPKMPDCGIIMHASAGTKLAIDPNRKVIVATAKEAVMNKCNGLSVHVNVGGNEYEHKMLEDLAKTAQECDELGLPLLAMMYPRGKNVNKVSEDSIALAARVGAELGADLVKCPYSGDKKSFKKVVDGCPVPILIAGGAKSNSDKDVLNLVSDAIDAGAIGVSIGRNVFAHENPDRMVKAIREIVMNNTGVNEALKILKDD